MKINFEKEVKKNIKVKVGDVLESGNTNHIYTVIRIVDSALGIRYALMDLNDGCYANGIYGSLEDLKESIVRDRFKHYSSDEYELNLRKKKKC